MWGIVPAAGRGSRIQPLAFSKELLPVGSRADGPQERPCAVSEYLVERMIAAGADKLCFVIAPGKCDLVEYYGARYSERIRVFFAVQPRPVGLCDAIFRAAPLIGDEERVLVGLPDTVWFPADGYSRLPDDRLSFLLFPVEHPELFDAVLLDADDAVRAIQVKQREPDSHWIWGGFKMPGRVFQDLFALWRRRAPRDEYVGTLVNAYLAEGARAVGVKTTGPYLDVGTLPGYRTAISLLTDAAGARVAIAGMEDAPPPQRRAAGEPSGRP